MKAAAPPPAGPQAAGDLPLAADALDPEVLAQLARLDPQGSRQVLARVLQAYAQHLATTAAALAEAGRSGDRAGMRRSAHSLKSSSAQVGALRLAELCRRIEANLPESASPTPAAASLEELPALLEALQNESVRIQAALTGMLGKNRVEP